MPKILAFAGSNHSNSINYKLVEYAVTKLNKLEVQLLDIRKWEVPMYSIDMDPDQTPDRIIELIKLIKDYDGFIIASPEHNGSIPAFFKNILDWLSRREKSIFNQKPMLLMSTSPGKGGASKNLDYLIKSLPYQGANVVSTFSLPSFYENYKEGVINEEFKQTLESALRTLEDTVNE